MHLGLESPNNLKVKIMCANRTLTVNDLPADLKDLLAQTQQMMAVMPPEAQEAILNQVVQVCRSQGFSEALLANAIALVKGEADVEEAQPEEGTLQVEVVIHTVMVDGVPVRMVPEETFLKVSDLAQDLGEKLEAAVQIAKDNKAHVQGLAKLTATILEANLESTDPVLVKKAGIAMRALQQKLPKMFK